jgi:peptide chain release factor
MWLSCAYNVVMSIFKVSQDKEISLSERMERLGVSEDDLKETFVRSSGPGGQKVNKASSCVHLVHVPSGLFVKCQQSRSQAQNRFMARRLLLDRIERIKEGVVQAERQRAEKIRRQKRRRSRRAKEKMLAEKHMQAEKKSLRSKTSLPLE